MAFSPPDPKENFDRWDEPRLHRQRLMKAKLVEFDISQRILFPLARHGIVTLGDLVATTPREISKISNIGAGSIEFLIKFVKHHRLSFGMKKERSH